MNPLTKRSFLFKVSFLVFGTVIAGTGFAIAAPTVRKLRASVKGISNQAFVGMRRRLRRLPIATVNDAFRLANRKAEIEITLS